MGRGGWWPWGAESQLLFDELAAEDCPESAEFDRELRRSTFQRASELVRQEQSLKAWQAFWETAHRRFARIANECGGGARRQVPRAGPAQRSGQHSGGRIMNDVCSIELLRNAVARGLPNAP